MSSHTSPTRLSQPELTEAQETWSTHSAPPSDEELALAAKAKEESNAKDPNVVDWDGDDDKENPRNWSSGYKNWITFQLGMLALAASTGSSIISPADDTIAEYVGVSSEVAVLSISLYM